MVGQADLSAGRAHLWIQNRAHTWWNVVTGQPWGRLDGVVAVAGFSPNQAYPTEVVAVRSVGALTIVHGSIVADAAGTLILDLSALPDTVVDVAVKVGQYD